MKTTRRSFIKGGMACLVSLGFLKIPEIPEDEETEQEEKLYFDPMPIDIDTNLMKQFKERLLVVTKQKGSKLGFY